MASHVLHALSDAGVRRAVVVVPPGDRGEQIEHALRSDAAGIELTFAVQTEPRGTADAALAAESLVSTTHVVLVNGDLPLLTTDQLRPLLCQRDVDAAVATANVSDPAQMGRIIRDEAGGLRKIVEWRDATSSERALREVNVGIYWFRAEFLWSSLRQVVSDAGSGSEAYATNVIPLAAHRQSARAVDVTLPDGRLNVETPSDVADAEETMRRRIVDHLLECGVQIRDRNAVWIDAGASVAPGAMLEPGTHIRGHSAVGSESCIGPNAIIEDARLGRGCQVESSTIRGSILADDVDVGPYSTIRPGCEIGRGAHIGAHAELKRARIGERAQIGHFSYIGDAVIGARANIGAGAVTCNFDGERKHDTTIGEDAFIGCDTMLIAPVTIGDRARTGAGAVVNKDVPADTNAVGHPARLTPSRRAQREEGRDA